MRRSYVARRTHEPAMDPQRIELTVCDQAVTELLSNLAGVKGQLDADLG